MKRIGIIGMGISGMAILDAYRKVFDEEELKEHFTFDCYDHEDSFGRGYPYREDSHDLILNLKTPMLSYDYERVEDFKDWYDEQERDYPEYSPRAVFGEYTKDRLEDTIEKTGANKIFSLVTRIDKKGDSWELEDELGEIRHYDEIHLCNGSLGQKNIYQLKEKDYYLENIYPVNEKLSQIQEEDHVVIVGAGLTAVDLAHHLIDTKKVKNVTMFSSSNRIPTVRVTPVPVEITHLTMDLLKEELANNYNRVTFDWFDKNFQKELELHDIDFDHFMKTHLQGGLEGLIYNIEHPEDLGRLQVLLPPMNGIFNLVWDSLSREGRIQFRKKYHPLLTLNRSPLPLESAEMLIEAHEKGILEMPGEVEDIEEIENGFHLLDEEGEKLNDTPYDFVLNATGLDIHFSNVKEGNPLLYSLLDKRYLMKDEFGGVTIIPETMEAISPRYGTLKDFHVYGVLASGVQYRNNSTMMIQMTAHKIAQLKKEEFEN